jgi:two-component system, LuxR family, sensor kinase FixL
MHSHPRQPAVIPVPSLWSQVVDRLRQGDARTDVVVFGGLLTLAIFVLDLILPLGIAGGVPYIAPVFMAMWLPHRRLIVVVAGVCTVLALAGLWLSPLGAELQVAIPNRLLAIAAIWIVAFLSLQRKRFEAALAESEATNRAVLATTADGILTLDAQGVIDSANPAVERLFGHPADELLGSHFTLLLDPEDRWFFRRDEEAYLRPGPQETSPTHELSGHHKNGTSFPIEVVMVPVMREDGAHYTVTVRDITERRMLEQYMLRRSEEERRAIGYTLHEEVGQALTGLSLISRQLARRLEGRDLVEAREIADIATLLHDVDQQALKLFGAVAPIDASGGLPDALSEMVHAVAERHGAECHVTREQGLPQVDKFTAAQLYDIVHDVLEGNVENGPLRNVDLRIGRNGIGNFVTVHLKGVVGAGAADWKFAMQPLRYRAKMIGARLETSRPNSDELLVTCSWSEPSPPAVAPLA